jgi:hypothetical protein
LLRAGCGGVHRGRLCTCRLLSIRMVGTSMPIQLGPDDERLDVAAAVPNGIVADDDCGSDVRSLEVLPASPITQQP